MSTTLQPYLDAVRITLEGALNLSFFPYGQVERHTKPEIEKPSSTFTTYTPLHIARNNREKILIETSVNSVRISIALKLSDAREKYIVNHLMMIMNHRAEDYKILRRVPIEGYQFSFLITNQHFTRLTKEGVIQFILYFIEDIDKEMFVLLCTLLFGVILSDSEPQVSDVHVVEGEIILSAEALNSKNWHIKTRILLNYGQHIGFLKSDGSFKISGVPNGSYIISVDNIDYIFEPLRVDITSKGKIRARKLTILQPNSVAQVQYPLKLTAREPTRFFRKREEWRITDTLFSPTFLMLALPMLVLLVIPKIMANDPEMAKELENMQMPKVDMPDVSELMANFFGQQNPKKKAVTAPRK